MSANEVVLDVRDVPYLDCVALGALMEADERLRAVGVKLRLRDANPRVQGVVDRTSLPDDIEEPGRASTPSVVLF